MLYPSISTLSCIKNLLALFKFSLCITLDNQARNRNYGLHESILATIESCSTHEQHKSRLIVASQIEAEDRNATAVAAFQMEVETAALVCQYFIPTYFKRGHPHNAASIELATNILKSSVLSSSWREEINTTSRSEPQKTCSP